jgi:hypothetical protein
MKALLGLVAGGRSLPLEEARQAFETRSAAS